MNARIISVLKDRNLNISPSQCLSLQTLICVQYKKELLIMKNWQSDIVLSKHAGDLVTGGTTKYFDAVNPEEDSIQ